MNAQTTDSAALAPEIEDIVRPRGEERIFVASQWQLMRWRFQKHKMALAGGAVLIVFYVLAIFCEFFAPYDPLKYDPKLVFVPPQAIRFRDENGFRAPFVYAIKQQIDPVSFRRTYVADETQTYAVKLFARGDPYKLWGLFEGDLHFIGTEGNAGPLHLVGTDRMGRDILSRLITGSRISLSIGLVGVFTSLILGILIGGFSGYLGGAVDTISQRLIEFLRSVPRIPLWMALSAAIPPFWSPIKVIVALDEDLETIIGFKVVEQAETPGLGGRILEPWFQEQFIGKQVKPALHLVINRRGDSPNEVDAITGATETSKALDRIINSGMSRFFERLGQDRSGSSGG